jgi:ribonuclease BN (tRNA processing enzyme)
MPADLCGGHPFLFTAAFATCHDGPMRLTVIGCSPAWPNPGGAHSGYLLEEPGKLLLECGPGVLSRLREREGWPSVDAIAITHFHLDHWGDLIPWATGGAFAAPPGPLTPLWLPPGGLASLVDFEKLLKLPDLLKQSFELREYVEGVPFEAAGFTITARQVPHYDLDAYALRVTDGDRTLAFSGDSAPTPVLAEIARDANLFLCEATLRDGSLDSEPRGHLSAEEAEAAFAASGAERLVLTHRPIELRDQNAGRTIAREGLVLTI